MNLETFLLPAAAKNNILVNDLKVFFSVTIKLYFFLMRLPFQTHTETSCL